MQEYDSEGEETLERVPVDTPSRKNLRQAAARFDAELAAATASAKKKRFGAELQYVLTVSTLALLCIDARSKNTCRECVLRR